VTKIALNHDLCPYLNALPRVLKTQRIQALEMGRHDQAHPRYGTCDHSGGSGWVRFKCGWLSGGGRIARAGQQPGKYLTAVRTARHADYDRVVFQFSGGRPAVTAGPADSARSRPPDLDRPGPGSDRRQPRHIQVISLELARGHPTA
jgi:hypothetical protein